MVPVPEVEKPRVTEIQVRIDCNGCVQKIKKALNGITGIYDVCIDLPQQKLTIIGWADPEKLIKAIKKTRKTATICPEPGPSDPASQPPEPPSAGGNPDATKPPGADGGPPAEPSKEPAPENTNPHQPTQENPSTAPPETKEELPSCPGGLKDGEVYVIYDSRNYSHNHGHGGRYHSGYNCPTAQAVRVKLSEQNNVNHIYNTYRPSPYFAEYLEIPNIYAHYNRTDLYGGEYLSSCRGRGNITSIFSDENPNACTIM